MKKKRVRAQHGSYKKPILFLLVHQIWSRTRTILSTSNSCANSASAPATILQLPPPWIWNRHSKMCASRGIFLFVCISGLVVEAFRSYPQFGQCDPRWGNLPMGTPGPGERSTICGEGCAMSSVSMALAGLKFLISGKESNPETLNSWLMANKGYTCADGDCNNLVLAAPSWLDSGITLVGEVPPPSIPSIQQGLLKGSFIYVAHVRNRSHFVLLTGYDPAAPDAFTVNDPMNYTS
jgi:hypothetical protein